MRAAGDAHLGHAQARHFAALLPQEGATLDVDDYEIVERGTARVSVLADNIRMSSRDERERVSTLQFDLRGNDGFIADSVEVSGTAGLSAIFSHLRADAVVVDLTTPPAATRDNEVLIRELRSRLGGVVRNQTIEA